MAANLLSDDEIDGEVFSQKKRTKKKKVKVIEDVPEEEEREEEDETANVFIHVPGRPQSGWRYYGYFKDEGSVCVQCELCRRWVRWLFYIEHDFRIHTLRVGQVCARILCESGKLENKTKRPIDSSNPFAFIRKATLSKSVYQDVQIFLPKKEPLYTIIAEYLGLPYGERIFIYPATGKIWIPVLKHSFRDKVRRDRVLSTMEVLINVEYNKRFNQYVAA